MGSLPTLYRLQQTDSQLESIVKQLELFKSSAAGENDLKAAQSALEKKSEEKREAERLLKAVELELASLEGEKKRVHDKLYGGKITNSKELSQLEQDLEQLNKRREKLDEQVLQRMEKAEKIQSELPKFNQELEEAKIRYEKIQQEKILEGERLKRQLEDLKTRRDSLAQQVEESILEKYTGLRERKGGLAVVKMRKNNCGGCHMLVPESSIQKVRILELEYCSSCGRILYLDREP